MMRAFSCVVATAIGLRVDCRSIRAAQVDRAMGGLENRHLTVRCPNLVWPSWKWSPKELAAFQNDPAEVGRRTNQHITEMVIHFRDRLFEWDVVNEVSTNHDLADIPGGRVPQCPPLANQHRR
jgi:hypothetical protein